MWTAISRTCMDQTLHQDQVWSEDYAHQKDFWYHSKWRPGGHLGCKHTWSRNSNNTNWISFKLVERKLRTANMYAHLFFVRFQKWRPYLFCDPHDNTVSAYISKIVQDRGLVTIIHIYRKSYRPMRFHVAPLSLTLSDLERSLPRQKLLKNVCFYL